MRRFTSLMLVVLLAGLPAGCQPVSWLLSPAQRDPGAACARVSLGDESFPLAEPGPYAVGNLTFAVTDPAREDAHVGVTVWYPAVDRKGSQQSVTADANPDRSAAPYPLIISSAAMGELLAPAVVTHGFVWASVMAIFPYRQMNASMIDQPLDLLFLLEQMASNLPPALKGLVDADYAGAIGYSFDGYNSLAMSGARIDPAYNLAQCPEPDPVTSAAISEWSAFSCGPAEAWDAFVAHVPEGITASDDGLWQPMTDPRIRAVMPMAAEGWWLFGERGLAAVDRPTLMLAGTDDELYPENALIYEHLGTPDKRLISFVGQNHDLIDDAEMIARIAHLASAFFGYHLQGRVSWQACFSEEFVTAHSSLAWGAYDGE